MGQLSTTAQWPKSRFDAQNTGQCPYEIGVVSNAFVLHSFPLYFKGNVYGSPAVAENGDVILGATDHVVYCISSAADIKWAFDGEDMLVASPMITKEGSVIIGSYSSKLYALNITTGLLQWNFTAGGPIATSAVATPNGNVIFNSFDKHTYCLYNNGSLAWKFYNNISTTSAPALSHDGGAVYISGGLQLLSLSALSGSLRWSWSSGTLKVGVSLVNPAIASDGSVLFASGSNIYQLSKLGSLKWQFQVIGDVMDAVSIMSRTGEIVLGTASYRGRGGSGYLYKLSSGGSLIWRLATGYQTTSFIKGVASGATITADSSIIYGGLDDALHCVSSDGKPLWNFTVFGYARASPVVTRTGQVIFAGPDEGNSGSVFFLAQGPTTAPTPAPSSAPTLLPTLFPTAKPVEPLILPYRIEIADSVVLWAGAALSLLLSSVIYVLRGFHFSIPIFFEKFIPAALTRRMQARRSTMSEALKIMPKIAKMGILDVVLPLTISLSASISNFLQIYHFLVDAQNGHSAQQDFAIVMIAARILMALYAIFLLVQSFAQPSLRELLAVEYFYSPTVWLIIVFVSLFDASHLRLLPWKQTEFVARSKGFPTPTVFRWTLLSSSLNSLIQLVLSAARGLQLASGVSFSLSLCSFLLTSVTASLKLTAATAANGSSRENRRVSQLTNEIDNLKKQLSDKSQESTTPDKSLELQSTTSPIVDIIPGPTEGASSPRRLNFIQDVEAFTADL